MADREEFDIVVIGAGPGGYVAAIKAAQEGKKTALIERKYLGGTCLNCGCIPTKTLLSNASVLNHIKRAEEYGIEVGNVKWHYDKMKKRKDQVVEKIRSSLGGLLQGNQIHIINGSAEFQNEREIKVTGNETRLIYAKKTIIATGSETLDIPAFPCDHQKIFNSTSILEIESLPNKLVIIGGGYIGCEFASLFHELGVKVTVVEALERLVQTQGKDVSQFLTSSFQERGIDLKLSQMVESIDTSKEGVQVKIKEGETLNADIALVSIGRRINTDGLSPEKAGIKLSPKGMIDVNSKMETSVPGIYAIGDVTGKAMLAHVASHQGIIAALNACGRPAYMHYHAVPAVIFTEPEIATVGMTLEEAKEQGYQAKVGKFPFQALGKAQATIHTEGFAQVVVEETTGQILGAQVIGHEASSLIAEMALAIQNELTADCVADTIHAHPTVAEGWLEAALLANETPVHLPPKKKK